MPRGHVHEAFTSDCLSLHLTVGVRVFRWADLLGEALADVVSRDVRFREALPPGLLTGGEAASVQGRFRELLQALAARARPEESVDRLAGTFFRSLSALPGGFFGGDDGEQVGPESVLEHAPGAVCRVVHRRGGRVALEYPGNQVDGPARIAPALDFIARMPRFRVRDLPAGLSPEGNLVLVRRLVRERFLRVVDTNQAGAWPS
jgi:hypothetical protein